MGSPILQQQFSRFSGVGTGENFASPFNDVASLYIPGNLRSALYWAEFVFNSHGSYRMALERVISYFLTDIEILDVGQDEQKKWLDFLHDTLHIMPLLQDMLRDRSCYGNGFASFVVPFKRFMVCPKCWASFPLNVVYDNVATFHFEFQIPDFIATCPSCKGGRGYRGPWKLDDRQVDIEKSVSVKRWSPHYIELLHDLYTEDVRYLWRINEDYKRQIRQGNLFHLERVSQELLESVHNNQLFRFNKGAVYHMKEPHLSGHINRGWGFPRIITNFRQLFYVQVLRRFNEAIALDYVIPCRVITPAPRQGNATDTGDMLHGFSGGDFRNQVKAMLRQRRRDPASMHILPFPVNFQMFGADANQLAPVELLNQAQQTLLNDVGVPVELYNGTLQLQAAPVALRLFEATWHHLVHDANAFLSWLCDEVADVMSWERVKVQLRRVTIADDFNKQMAVLQLMASNAMSGTSALKALGYNWPQEQRQIAEEAREQAELQSRTQEEMEQAGFAQQIAKGQLPGQAPAGGDPSQGGGAGGGAGGAAPAGGDPSQGGMSLPVSNYIANMGNNTPQNPEEMLQAADGIAQELLGKPESIKNSELRKLKQFNEPMHAMVLTRLGQQRRQIRSDAGNQALGQMQQGGGQ